MDDVSTEALRRELMSGSNMGKKVRTFFSSSNQLVFRRTMANKIKGINDRLAAVSKNHANFHLEVRHEESRAVLRVREQTHSYIPEENVIGRESDRKAILDLLLDTKVEEDVSVLPIVSLGGLGKTTLAQFVFNHEKVRTNFDLKMWVCVLENFDVKSLVEKIIKSVTDHCEKNQEMDQLQRKLQKEINGKCYFLVLDDVWNENREEWLKLKNLLSKGAKGSRIIITTRSQKVGEITTHTMKPYKLGFLDKDNSWSLFKNVAFRPGHEPNNPNTKKTALEIVDKCGGIPLVIRTIGSMLYSKPEAQWSSFLEMEFLRMPQNENNILATLKLSYDNLPSNLKCCFAYCSLFPKDYEIEVDMLIKLWMAQGFIKPSSSGQSLEEAGFEIFNELYLRSFFQEVKENDWTKKLECKMHDLMHDLAVQVAGTECATLHSVGENIDGRPWHVSFNFDLNPSGQFPTFLSKENRIQTILFPPLWGNSGMLVSWDVVLGLKVLHTLDLHHSRKGPNSIGKLKHLRYLDLSRNYEIRTLPTSVAKLQNLQTLKLSNCTNLVELPRDLKKLVNLRHLENDGCDSLTHMPLGLGQLHNLVTLNEFVVNEEGVGPTNKPHNQGQVGVGGLNELMELNNLRGELDVRNLRYGKDASEEYKDANLKEKQHLYALRLSWSNRSNDSNDNVDATSMAEDYEITLESLQPHTNLKKLRIFGYRASVRVAKLELTDNYRFKTFERTQRMKMKMMDSFSPLSKLSWLKIERIKSLQSLSEGLTSSLISLRKLCIWECPKLKTLLPTFQQLTSLQELEISSCHEVDIYGDGGDGNMWQALQSLLILILQDLPQLGTLPDRLQQLTSLEKLTLEECKSLVGIPEWIGNLKSLRELRIRGCNKLTSLPEGLHQLTSLQSLDIRDLPQLETFPDGLQELTSLRELKFYACESLVGSPEWIGNLKSLRELGIGGPNKLTSLPKGMYNERINPPQEPSTSSSSDDPKETEHLLFLDEAKERRHLLKANLLEEGSFDSLVEWCLVKGTLNVLRSFMKFRSVKIVVVTSSMVSLKINGKPLTLDMVVDETWFSDPDVCEELKLELVCTLKTLADDATWKFAKENKIDLVTMHPGFTIGSFLQSTLNVTAEIVLNHINGTV
ncbi:disease resistance protein RGA2-like [Ziziphus jujuba]|uniref:Disease resistance protein RGA2-like n=1 Tax=Ziziphus jujuba TaxID=326968 RepID=A0ABM4A149_ZIZJJ|nr:disease resistance protein RGA2-like [Ziziphus jujuba]